MTKAVNKISSLINEHISKGFILESDIIHFIKSAYGLSKTDEIIDFLENSIDEAIVNMISYPSDNFREEIEEFIPLEGISFSDIKKIEDSVNILSSGNFISFNKRIPLSKDDSLYCQKKFVQRLNLNAALNFISDNNLTNAVNLSAVKAILRKKKFTSNSACYDFINKLILNYTVPENDADKEYLKLIDLSSDLFHGTDKDPFDILSDKKDFYIRALLEYDEFNNLLKSYSMEFIMMKKIHAPLVPVDEAVSMIKLIEKITRIAYRTY